MRRLIVALAACLLAASVPASAQIVDLVGDEDNFGYGGTGSPPCAFYNLAEPEDVGVFDLELTDGDETQAWTHDFTDDPAFGAGFVATSVTIEIREYFSDIDSSTITVDGTVLTFVGAPSGCSAPVVQTFSFPDAASAAFANDGIINITFNENGDHIALDYSRVTVTYEAATAAPPEMSQATASFAIYNQGRGQALESHHRAVLSDHASLNAHVLGQGDDDELASVLVSDLSCTGEGCTPSLSSGQSAQFQAGFEYPRRGLGRLEIGSGPNGASQNDETGAFTLTATAETDSVVSWLPGRYLWIVADSALDEVGEKIGEAGQQLAALTGNDAQKELLSNDTPTFGELSHLIAEFAALVGSSGDDTPRLVIDFGDDGTLAIRLNDADSGENMVGDDDPIRFDTSGLAVVAELQDETTDYETALAAAGSFTIERIDFVVDDPGAEPPRQYRLDSILVAANAPAVTAASAQAAAATPRPSAPAASQPFTQHPPRDVAPRSLRSGIPAGGNQRSTGPVAERP